MAHPQKSYGNKYFSKHPEVKLDNDQSAASVQGRNNVFFEIQTNYTGLSIHQYHIVNQPKSPECIHSLQAFILPEHSQHKFYLMRKIIPQNYSFKHFCSPYEGEHLPPENKTFIEQFCTDETSIIFDANLLDLPKNPNFAYQASEFFKERIIEADKMAVIAPTKWFAGVQKNIHLICALLKTKKDINGNLINFI